MAIVALEARIRKLEPALDALAQDPVDGPRLRAIAAVLRDKASGYAPIQFAADELERIAQIGAGVLARAPSELLGAALESMHKLHREPGSSRATRRADAAIEDRQARRIAKSERLQGIARAGESLH